MDSKFSEFVQIEAVALRDALGGTPVRIFTDGRAASDGIYVSSLEAMGGR